MGKIQINKYKLLQVKMMRDFLKIDYSLLYEYSICYAYRNIFFSYSVLCGNCNSMVFVA